MFITRIIIFNKSIYTKTDNATIIKVQVHINKFNNNER